MSVAALCSNAHLKRRHADDDDMSMEVVHASKRWNGGNLFAPVEPSGSTTGHPDANSQAAGIGGGTTAPDLSFVWGQPSIVVASNASFAHIGAGDSSRKRPLEQLATNIAGGYEGTASNAFAGPNDTKMGVSSAAGLIKRERRLWEAEAAIGGIAIPTPTPDAAAGASGDAAAGRAVPTGSTVNSLSCGDGSVSSGGGMLSPQTGTNVERIQDLLQQLASKHMEAARYKAELETLKANTQLSSAASEAAARVAATGRQDADRLQSENAVLKAGVIKLKAICDGQARQLEAAARQVGELQAFLRSEISKTSDLGDRLSRAKAWNEALELRLRAVDAGQHWPADGGGPRGFGY